MWSISLIPARKKWQIRIACVNGFTLIELLVVMAAIGLLLAITVPRYTQHLDRTREVVLRQNLVALRESIDKFHADKGRYPLTLLELVQTRYLREMPLDPVTDRVDSWVTLPPTDGSAGVFDVHSGARGIAQDGSAYASW